MTAITPARSTARRALWGFNALLGAGVLAYLCHATVGTVRTPTTERDQSPSSQATPTTPTRTPATTTTTPALPVPLDDGSRYGQGGSFARTQSGNPLADRLTFRGYDAYNALVPTIIDVAEREKVPADILSLIVLNESKGKSGTRYEPGFQAKYVAPVLDGTKDATHKQMRLTLEKMLATQTSTGKVASKDEFATKLATSYGPVQIMYLVAVERGFRGSAEELADPATNLAFAAKRIKAHAASTSTPDPASPAQRVYDWRKVLIDYNSGSVHGTPHPGYVERGTVYARKLGL